MHLPPFAFGEKMKEIRGRCELSLRAVSRDTGISAVYLGLLEKGTKRNPSVQMFLSLCRYYGIDPTEEIMKF